jgi:hypothetical protein
MTSNMDRRACSYISTITNILQLFKWRTLVRKGYNRRKLDRYELAKQDSRYIGTTVSVSIRNEYLLFFEFKMLCKLIITM